MTGTVAGTRTVVMRAALVLPALIAIAFAGCAEKAGSGGGVAGSGQGGPVTAGTQTAMAKVPTGVRPRVVLDTKAIAALKGAAKDESRAWMENLKRCEIFKGGDKSAGYLGLQWAEAVLSLSICWHGTGQTEYANVAVKYLTALLDDREAIGDGAGGDAEVRRNSGYPIRAHGVAAALGYDWLYNAEAMTPALRQKIASRLDAWLTWYAKDGYLNDNPFANYFWGYAASLAFAGLALDGEANQAQGWLRKTEELFEKKVIPGFAKELKGGAWIEGWQYGPLVSVNLAMIVRGFQTARGVDYAPRLPWFGEVVKDQLHQLHPNRETAHSNGTHRIKPAIPTSTPLTAAAFILEANQPELAAEARFIERKLLPLSKPKYPWFALLASLAGSKESDPLEGEPLSYHLEGSGMTFARSSWDRRAVWSVIHAGAKIAVDHQHNDQGHFELWRGADALFVDGGDTEAFATINHNTILVDDAKRTLSYSPNQGVWAKNSRTLGYGDDGRAVVVVGDLTGAWDPKCAQRGCAERTVRKAIRTFIYLRPNILVIDDVVSVEKKSDLVTWAAHVRAKPTIRSSSAEVELGGSRADLDVLLPKSAKLRAPKEPTSSESHIYRRNEPRGDVWRIEAPSNSKSKDHRFRVWMSASNRGAKSTDPVSLPGSGITSIVTHHDTKRGVLFADSPAGGSGYAKPDSTFVVVGLSPEASYRVVVDPKMANRHGKQIAATCAISITKDGAGKHTANKAGALSFELKNCALGR